MLNIIINNNKKLKVIKYKDIMQQENQYII